MRSLRSLLCASALSCLLAAFSAVRADTLLLIDPSDLSAVVITATANVSAVQDDSATLEQGVILAGLFQADFSVGGSSTANDGLVPGDSTAGFDSYSNDWGNLTQRDLNIYGVNGSGDPVIYSTLVAAFTGSTILNLTGALLTAGTTGDIVVGDSVNGSGAVIGQWAVVPEPATMAAVLGAGVLALVFVRRLRRGNQEPLD